ncbi:hypothetical protein M1N88_03635 [Dehalococcoidia bacterium]|nr:hypothetical protein [Dehalococcoidia bacterium]
MFDILFSMIGFLLIQLALFSIAGFWGLGGEVNKLANDISHIQEDILEIRVFVAKE